MSNNAAFQFLGYQVVETSLKQKFNGTPSSKINTGFEIDGEADDTTSTYKLTVATRISDDNDVLNAEVKIVGVFKYDQSTPQEHRNAFFKVNGPAILFPYIRAYISSLTALGGMAPIILPTINFSKLAQKKCE